MFEFVRQHTKIMMGVMFLLIIPSFLLFGIDGYTNLRDKGEAVALVGGQEVTQADWDFAHKSETDRLRAAMPNLDPKLLDSPEARYATLERLVRERVLAKAADTLKLTTSDTRLARDLQENPTIAALRRADGSLDMERYRQLVASQGLTPEGFEARVRQDLSVRQVEAIVTGTGTTSAALADVALNAFFERREVQFVILSSAEFAAKVNPSEADLEAFYKANPTLFQAPEQASIEYLVLDLEAVKKAIVISDADLKSYYEQNLVRLSGNEERRASHILINAAKDAPAAERKTARARADELLLLARKAPEGFGELAKKNSQDTGSATSGGDLDYFARGAMVKPFEDAAFAMKKGDVSDVVETDFGYHIIKLTDVKIPKQRSFDELRAGIETELKTQQAQRKFAESAEAFTNGVYEQSDSLKPVAEKLKLEIKTVAGLGRQAAPAAKGVLANPKFLSAVFASDTIDKKRNTEAVEVGPNQLAAARVVQHTPARTLPLADVKSLVRDRVVASRAAELAKKDGADKLAAWKAGPDAAVMPAVVTVSRDQAQNIPPAVLKAALRADTTVLPQFLGIDLGASGYAVLRVNKATARPAPLEAAAKQDRGQYTQWWTAAEGQAYYALLKDRFKVEMRAPKPAGSPGGTPLSAVN